MSQNQEIIESKLCAYIDGDLDADGRTEIEKHLDANPQHRRLLESLKATRDLIKWLPREPAPPELAETLNGQLERSVLLDFDERSLNRNIWPRVLSAAAIVLLTAGLGAAVYFTLPKGQKAATPYALHNPGDLQSPMPDGSPSEPVTEPAHPDDALAAGSLMAKSASPILSAKPELDRAPNPELDRLASDVSQNKVAIVAVANAPGQTANLPQASTMSPNVVVMLVHADSTDQATHDVTSYLDAQNIQYKPAADGPSEVAVSPGGAQAIDRARESMRDSMGSNAARHVQIESATRPDGQSNLLASTASPSQTNDGQLRQSQGAMQLAANVYVARMSRQQAIDLNNSVQQRRSRKSELKDLTGKDQLQSQISQAQSQTSQGQTSPYSPRTFAQSQIQSQTAPAMAPAPAATSSMKFLGVGPDTSATTQRAEPAQGIAGRTGGGSFGGQGAVERIRDTPASEPTTAPGAATLPATTEAADAAIDVVIVVQPDAPSTEPGSVLPRREVPSTQPASTPAAPPTTQPATH